MQTSNDELRRTIYKRDKGICWVCHNFVEYDMDYDLGHLVDKSNGGKLIGDNLAVMHHKCNITKPRHKTLDEAVRWQLNNRFLISAPLFNQNINTTPIKLDELIENVPHQYSQNYTQNIKFKELREPAIIDGMKFNGRYGKRRRTHTYNYIATINDTDYKASEQLIIEYFNEHKNLFFGDKRVATIRGLSKQLNIPTTYIRDFLVTNGLITFSNPRQPKDNIYEYVFNNLDSLLVQVREMNCSVMVKCQKLGITYYMYKIMLFLGGYGERINQEDRRSIDRRVKALNLHVRSPNRSESVVNP